MKVGDHYVHIGTDIFCLGEGEILTVANIIPDRKYSICLMVVGTEHVDDDSSLCYWMTEEELNSEFIFKEV